MLYDNQKPISDDIYKNISKKELYNIPTGRGKTYILLDVAKRFIQEGKSVIISVPNNNLVRDMYNTSLMVGLEEDTTEIVIGKDNYISVEKLKEHIENFSILSDYITEESFKKYLEFIKDEEVLYFDDFDRLVDYHDAANSYILKNILSPSTMEKTIKEKEGLTITNHYYLLNKLSYSSDLDVSSFVILIDEVHELSDIAENIFSNNFSTFEFKNIISLILKDVKEKDIKGKITLEKSLKTLFVKTNKIHNKFKSEGKVGTYEKGTSSVMDFQKAVSSILNSKEYKYIKNKIDIQEYGIKTSDLDNIKNYTQNEEFKVAGLYYSPSWGYPNLKISRANSLALLNKMLWEKVEMFAGVSATVTSSFNPDEYERKYAYERLGMLMKGRKDYNIRYYKRLFPRELVNIYLPEEEMPKMSNLYNDNVSEDDEYYNYLVDKIFNTIDNKNGIVLCGGYKEAKFLGELYSSKYLQDNIIIANPHERTTTTLEKFKDQGGLLFATRNYNTGISLEGDKLEKLYILKLPFVDFTSKKWIEVRAVSQGKYFIHSFREMLITLMQTLGRLQRTKDDGGDIYLLDSRYDKYNKNNTIRDILDEYGVVVKPEKIKKVVENKNIYKGSDDVDLMDLLGFAD